MLPLEQSWNSPNASTTIPPWVDINCEDAELRKTHLQAREVDVLWNPIVDSGKESHRGSEATMIDYQDLNSPYTSIYGISPLQETNMSSVNTQPPVTGHSNINLSLALQSAKGPGAQQHVSSLHDTTISRHEPSTNSLSPPFMETELNNDGNAWVASPPPIRTRKSSKGPMDSRRQVGPPTKSSIPRVSSKAIEMITDVQNLYKFGVSIGILPEDKETQLSLRRMKRRFVSLLPQPYISDSDSSRGEHSDGESDDTEFR
ncbi:hypothetical protein EYB26_002825 [Talaromyces marneffei]|uniref:uncharacterized protein n=1 Tax=Talaromyces marneffei TaxID=37727 RepID=UPI0012A90EF4|nr:uncharacterized protein EYB26_002825 [Talaromyces marneffei]QGA15169.1 hypothetical protein EYB26_002825 [Talaromyces marneffei]